MGYMIVIEACCPICKTEVKYEIGTDLKGECSNCGTEQTLDTLVGIKAEELVVK